MSGSPGTSTGNRKERRAVRMLHAVPPGSDTGWGPAARFRRAWRLARALRARGGGPSDPGDEVVRWPDAGPVPVIHAEDGDGIRIARLALALTGSPARLVGVWTRTVPPWDPRSWNRCDVVAAVGPAAARSLREAGVDVRRIRLLEREGHDPVPTFLERVALAPADLVRRVDWTLR